MSLWELWSSTSAVVTVHNSRMSWSALLLRSEVLLNLLRRSASQSRSQTWVVSALKGPRQAMREPWDACLTLAKDSAAVCIAFSHWKGTEAPSETSSRGFSQGSCYTLRHDQRAMRIRKRFCEAKIENQNTTCSSSKVHCFCEAKIEYPRLAWNSSITSNFRGN